MGEFHRHPPVLPVLAAFSRYGEALPADYWNPGSRLAKLADIGVDEAVLFPNYGLLWERTLHQSLPALCANMEAWNETLAHACARYPTMRVYDWATEVRDEWFIPDGIHPSAAGYRERAARFARALARAFPKDGPPSPECFVQGGP